MASRTSGSQDRACLKSPIIHVLAGKPFAYWSGGLITALPHYNCEIELKTTLNVRNVM